MISKSNSCSPFFIVVILSGCAGGGVYQLRNPMILMCTRIVLHTISVSVFLFFFLLILRHFKLGGLINTSFTTAFSLRSGAELKRAIDAIDAIDACSGAGKLVIFNKPFQVLSKFTDAQHQRATLANYINFPKVYPAGRLDYDSEGLLLLTSNGLLQKQISHPKYKLEKTYWVQVEGTATPDHCQRLLEGVHLKDGRARALSCKMLSEPKLWPRTPPIRFRKSVPDTWLELTINEGRNRQVRRMSAAVGLPTLRLIRTAIGGWRLDDLLPGHFRVEAELTGGIFPFMTSGPRRPRPH